ncbi:hypothetical protein P4O66_005546 [Electrophorus voltai]|uniref:Uncharacterized protein n=1 Tax=Electrophorus voltai TaxID=2609070 RepID=A0AAD8ZK45_9TELE|nr:hypothetical protein P4O66_005546 [Electrophorus voltai]
MGNITVWSGNCTKQDRQTLQRVVRSAECITHMELPDLQTNYYKRCQTKARRIAFTYVAPSVLENIKEKFSFEPEIQEVQEHQ